MRSPCIIRVIFDSRLEGHRILIPIHYLIIRFSLAYLLVYGYESFLPLLKPYVNYNNNLTATYILLLVPLIVGALLAYLVYMMVLSRGGPLKKVYQNVSSTIERKIEEYLNKKGYDDKVRLRKPIALLAAYLIAVRVALVMAGDVGLMSDMDELIERKVKVIIAETLKPSFVAENKASLYSLAREVAYMITDYAILGYEAIRAILSPKNLVVLRPLSILSRNIKVKATAKSLNAQE